MARKKKGTAPEDAETGTATAVARLTAPLVKAQRKKRTASFKTNVTPVESVAAPPAPALVEAVPAPSATTTDESHQAASPEAPEEQPDRPRFRSWTVRNASGYEKLTDTKRGLIVLKFQDRPSNEILNAVKDGGFQYSPDYEDQGKVWLRKNDFEGRVQVDKIEAALRQQEQGSGIER